jgi:hypothetical protein
MISRRLLGLTALALVSSAAFAAPITAGNLVLVRSGDGSAALSGVATAVFIDEYTTSGTLVQSFSLSTAGAPTFALTGNSTTEGVLSLSQDGSRFAFTGYKTTLGTASGFNSSNKILGTLTLGGVLDISTEVTDAGTNATRSATTVNGSSFYFATGGAVRYVASAGSATTSTVIDARNSRQVLVRDNILYGSNGSTTVTNKLQAYGVLPTGVTTPTAVATLATTDAINGFSFLDLNAGVAGSDVVYALSTVENLIRKYSFDGTNWVSNGSVAAGTGAPQNLVAVNNGAAGVDLYITNATGVAKLTDTSGYNATINGTVGANLFNAGTNTAFRGISMVAAPVPEPGTMIALGLGAVALIRKRRSKKA